MKVNELRQIIKQLVKEETQQTIKQLVSEEVSKAMGKVLVEMVKEIKKPNPADRVVREEVEEDEPVLEEVRKPATVINTKNPKLNSVLAETAANFRGLPRTADSEPVSLDGEFSKIGDESVSYSDKPKSNIGFMKQIISENVAPSTPSVLDAKSHLPDHLQKLFSGKNLGAILKKSKEPGAGSGAMGTVGTM